MKRKLTQDELLPDDEEEEEKKDDTQISYKKLLMTFADSRDKSLIAVGYLLAAVSGAGMPLLVYLTSSMVGSLARDDDSFATEVN